MIREYLASVIHRCNPLIFFFMYAGTIGFAFMNESDAS
jgi:hypothetical protein